MDEMMDGPITIAVKCCRFADRKSNKMQSEFWPPQSILFIRI